MPDSLRPKATPLVPEKFSLKLGVNGVGRRKSLLFTRRWETHRLTEEGAGRGHCLTWVGKLK
jgi:hypothetical protein